MNAKPIAIDAGLLALPEPLPSGVRCFRGIRYAAAPVGALRWRPPQSVEPWSGVRPTDVFGPNSMQGVVFDDIDPLTHGISEDCLYLNVWTPSLKSHEPLAVMVWIHGGGFVVGSGGEPRYDGANLAAKGIVVVTLNHRLNALGFFAHPELTAESPNRASGNYGMLDLIAALQWVAQNIGAFGGDPGRVTIAGESAGSMAVSALMASPMARGLFARAIGESGALFPSPSRSVISLDEAERAGVKFARELNAVSLAELRAMPAASILAASPGADVRPFRPIVDGYFLPRPPSEIFADGAQNDVPLLAGWNKDEGFNFSLLKGGEKSYGALTRAIFGERSGAALALYPSGSPETDKASARALGGDLVIIHPTWAWIEAQKRTGRSEIYRFRFDRAPLTPEGWFGATPSAEAGAFHAGELLYVFDNLHVFAWRITETDRAIAAMTSAYWTNFVKTGDPNGTGLPVWRSYRQSDGLYLAIDRPAELRAETDKARHEFLALASRQS